MFNVNRLRALCAATLLTFTAALSTPALAMNDAMLDLLKILKDKGSLSESEYQLLLNAAKADGEKVDSKVNEASAKVEEATKSLPKVNTDGKLEISKGDNKFRIGGRLQADTTFGVGDVTFAGSEGDNVVTEFRRARVYISGVLQKYWKYKFQYDFAGQSAAASTGGIRDAYIAYTGFKPVEITFGHHKTPLSLEELTSSKYITFIERSQLVNGIVTDTGGGRKYALSAKSYFGDMFTAATSVHAGTANEDTADTTFGITGRLTFSPIHEKTRAVHLGVGFDRSKQQGGGFNIDGEPEIHPGADILENEATDHTSATTFVAEAAGIYGPFSLQAEYAMADVEDSPTSPDIDAEAWYVFGSYYLTGESRNYKWEKGSFSQTKVKNPLFNGGLGAWEVALRYAGGDFENAGGLVSSEADILTVGLNWYPSNNIRFSGNYVTVLDGNTAADAELAGDLEPGSTADDAEYFIIRGQWYF